MSYQLTGAIAIRDALESGVPRLTRILARKGPLSEPEAEVLALARAQGIKIRFESAADVRRMARDGESALLGLAGRDPEASLESVLAGDGPVWLLAGATYPGNVGFVIRTVEVAGAAGIVIDGAFARKTKRLALRVSMRAERFMPVFWDDSLATVAAARAAGRPILALEDSGEQALSDAAPGSRPLVLVGGERYGLTADLLDSADAVYRIPMPGFIGSYNLQAAVSMGCWELIRDENSPPKRLLTTSSEQELRFT